VPIRYSRPVRKRLLGAAKALKKGPAGALGLLKGLKLKDLAPEAPSISNFTTGEVMGHSSDRLAAKFGISRKDQDDYTLMSHTRAQQAHDDGLYAEELVPGVQGADLSENGIKAASTPEKLAKLKPAFIKNETGTHTAANSSFLTDGAAATLVMSEEKALALGFKPKAYLRHWTFAAVDPFEELLLGPTYAVSKVLNDAKLDLKDVGARAEIDRRSGSSGHTSHLSSSVASTSIRLAFGRIDRARRVLDARQKASRRRIRLR
jgi:acetyl-CoA acyltransferase